MSMSPFAAPFSCVLAFVCELGRRPRVFRPSDCVSEETRPVDQPPLPDHHLRAVGKRKSLFFVISLKWVIMLHTKEHPGTHTCGGLFPRVKEGG